MYRFADQIEFRTDRRHILFFLLGGLVWTTVAFLFGMLVAENKSRSAERGLVALGWLDKEAEILKKTSTQHSLLPPTQSSKKKSLSPNTTPQFLAANNTIETYLPQQKNSLHTTIKKRNALAHNNKLSNKNKLLAKLKKKSSLKKKRLIVKKKKESSKVGTAFKADFVSSKKARYTTLLHLSKNYRNVINIYRKLKIRGYHPILAAINTKKRHYRLTLGHFASRRSAWQFLKKFKRQTRVSGNPLPLKSSARH